MSLDIVHAGKRLNVISAPVAHDAGDFIYYNGFYGHCQDDWIVGRPAVLILDAGVVKLRNIFGSTLAMGVKVSAAPSAHASTLIIYPAGSVPSGANPIGRIAATGVASSATATLKVALFHPNAY